MGSAGGENGRSMAGDGGDDDVEDGAAGETDAGTLTGLALSTATIGLKIEHSSSTGYSTMTTMTVCFSNCSRN